MANKKRRKRVNNSAVGANVDRAFQAAVSSGQAGAGTCTDLGSSYSVNLNGRSFEQRIRDNYALYQNTWEGRKIINIPIFDMLRNGWNYEGFSEQELKLIEQRQHELEVLNRFKEALRLERLEGGAVIFMGVSDGAKSPAEPLLIDNIGVGDLRFINTIARHKVSDISIDIDPLSPTYGNPTHYYIQGQQVHKSRLIVFDGDPVTQSRDNQYMQFKRQDGFGEPILDAIYYEIIRAIGTRQAAFQLVNKSGMFFAMMDTLSLESTTEGNEKLDEMEQIIRQLSLYNGAIMHTDSAAPTTLQSITPNFGGVPELVDKLLRVVSSAGDIPAPRFLSESPGGLNSSGDSDLENYYGRLESEQELILKPKINQLLSVLGRSLFGASFNDESVSVEFEPLWSISSTEKVANDAAIVNKYAVMVQSGMITDEEAVAGIKEENAVPAHAIDDLDNGLTDDIDSIE